jgi:hypothetical protein
LLDVENVEVADQGYIGVVLKLEKEFLDWEFDFSVV